MDNNVHKRRPDTPVEVVEERRDLLDGMISDANSFIKSTYAEARTHPNIMKNGQRIHKREDLPIWNGEITFEVSISYRETRSKKNVGRPKKT